MPNSPASEGDRHAREQWTAETQEPGGAHDRVDQAPRDANQPGGSVAVGGPGDLSAELERMEDRYKRALADLDNYRKRSARETERRVTESRERLLRDWLEAVDSVERALLMQPEDSVLEGLRAVLEQMDAVLARQGVERVGAAGERFDPERHEAISARHTNEVPDRTVVDVARSGYALGDRLLRPAQVVVSRQERDE